jgi:4-amino-4-deoxy-L-arabinose transferase-like glycosyltransferase
MLIESFSLYRASIFGLVAGLAILTKFSAIAFLIAGCTALLLLHPSALSIVFVRRGWRAIRVLFAIVLSGALAIWATYRFSFSPLLDTSNNVGANLSLFLGSNAAERGWLHGILTLLPIPALEFFWGLFDLFYFRREEGHLAFFLGDIGKTGWWSFYPVLLLVKTPVAFVLFSAMGVASAFLRPSTTARGVRDVVAASVAILLAGALATPNNGIRQILPIFPLLAIVAGSGAAWLLHGAQIKKVGLLLVLTLSSWCAVSSLGAHPHYLAYFNGFAGPHPERIAIDSDLDWGQDLKSLSAVCRERSIEYLVLRYNGSKGINLSLFPLPTCRELQPYEMPSGWIAISMKNMKMGTGVPPYDQFAWLANIEAVQKVGQSILLYNIP